MFRRVPLPLPLHSLPLNLLQFMPTHQVPNGRKRSYRPLYGVLLLRTRRDSHTQTNVDSAKSTIFSLPGRLARQTALYAVSSPSPGVSAAESVTYHVASDPLARAMGPRQSPRVMGKRGRSPSPGPFAAAVAEGSQGRSLFCVSDS